MRAATVLKGQLLITMAGFGDSDCDCDMSTCVESVGSICLLCISLSLGVVSECLFEVKLGFASWSIDSIQASESKVVADGLLSALRA